MINKITTFLRNKLFFEIEYKTNNIYAYNLLQKYLINDSFLPVSNSALDFYTIAIIVNEIIINRRKKIIEFGSGVSSIIIARLINSENLNTHIFSIDDNLEWINVLQKIIDKENLQESITLIYANSISCDLAMNDLNWYNIDSINKVIRNNVFDLVIVDGPCAYTKKLELSRFPAMLYMKNKLRENYAIFIDDIDREGEKKILHLWEEELDIKFKPITKKLSLALKGAWYNTII